MLNWYGPSSMTEPKVSIIIVHLDNQTALLACLKSCQTIQYSNYEIIVVENGSRRPLDSDYLKSLAGRTLGVIRSLINVGFAGGNNLGIGAALDRGADYVLLLNDDTEVTPEFLNVLVQVGEQDESVGAAKPGRTRGCEPTC